MKFLIDECLHTSLVAVAQAHGHDCFHVNWLGLSGETDWDLMPRVIEEDLTFVTNNARDEQDMVNEVIEVTLDGEDAVVTRYSLPEA